MGVLSFIRVELPVYNFAPLILAAYWTCGDESPNGGYFDTGDLGSLYECTLSAASAGMACYECLVSAVIGSAVQCSAVKCSAVQCSTLQCSAVRALQCSAVQ